jgi:HEPN domain-containing protein
LPQHDEREIAEKFLAKAVGDEAGLRALEAHDDVPDHVPGFLAQQAVEKQIKAVLTARGIAFKKSHELSYLVGLIEENKIDAPSVLDQVDTLTDWAVGYRYPDIMEPPALDRAEVLKLVVEVREWAQAQIAAIPSKATTAAEQESSTESDSDQSSTPSS